jgi:hypothetical protein
MKNRYDRRRFIRDASLTAGAITFSKSLLAKTDNHKITASGRIGIIGLDTSHCIAFTKALNGSNPSEKYSGFKISQSTNTRMDCRNVG